MALTIIKPTVQEVKAAMDADFYDLAGELEAGNLQAGRDAIAAMAVLQHEVTRLRALLPPGV